MNIPTEQECMNLLEEHNPRMIEHSVFVKELSLKIADIITQRGINVNRELLIAGALLHDIKKSHVGDQHNKLGERFLLELGYPEVARICKNHFFETSPETTEEKIVFYVDKITNPFRTLVTVEERLEYIFNKYGIPVEKHESWSEYVKNIEEELLDGKRLL
ncbi:HD domain-containing protein [Candidatus Woesearchaeota archaeon]|nr:HD domain-containing protein [Candidatus Woesearchaeota archaeon]